jgi:hypothetical protein
VVISGTGPIFGGATGTLTCPDGTEESVEVNTFISVTKGHQSGVMQITLLENSTRTEQIEDAFNHVQITKNRFSFSGILTSRSLVEPEFQSICDDSNFPTKASVSGPCGEGVTIKMEATNGEHGIFLGDVSCGKSRF